VEGGANSGRAGFAEHSYLGQASFSLEIVAVFKPTCRYLSAGKFQFADNPTRNTDEWSLDERIGLLASIEDPVPTRRRRLADISVLICSQRSALTIWHLLRNELPWGVQEDRVSGSSRHALSQVSSFVCWTMRVAVSNVLSQLDDRLL
jgi:hypothetical protein